MTGNPAVAVARMLSDTWTGIRPGDVPLFVVGQLGRAAVAFGLVRWLFQPDDDLAADIVVPHDQPSQTTAPTGAHTSSGGRS